MGKDMNKDSKKKTSGYGMDDVARNVKKTAKNTADAVKKNGRTRVIALTAMILVFIIIFSAVINFSLNSGTRTDTAVMYTFKSSVGANMYIIRNEDIIKNTYGGSDIPVRRDGEKVSKGGVVAYSYKDGASAENVNKMMQISDKIAEYGSLKNLSAVDSDQIDYSGLIDSIKNYSVMTSSGNLADKGETGAELAENIIYSSVSGGSGIDIDAKISELQKEYDSLASSTGSYGEITTDESGYFVSSLDGYENLISADNIDSVTADEVEKALNSKPGAIDKNKAGKVITGFCWYMACILDKTDAVKLSEGRNYSVSFTDSSADDVTAKVYKLSDAGNGKTLVIFRVSDMNSDLAQLRKETAVITVTSYTGYRVEKSALREVDGKMGIYIVSGGRARFRRCSVIYYGDDYAILKTTDDVLADYNSWLSDEKERIEKEGGKFDFSDYGINTDSYVNLYDTYIVDGKDVTNGKSIRAYKS